MTDEEKLRRAERALREIAEHKGCTFRRDNPDGESPEYNCGVEDGHRAAAIIARHALKELS